MAKTNSFVVKLTGDFPDIHFVSSDDFYWSPSTKTVYTASVKNDQDRVTLLHEVAHALLDHRHFARDIDLLRVEREAWDYAKKTLAPRYDVMFDNDLMEDMLDSYRNWLHARSTCPLCSLTGLQTGTATYHCLGCAHDWRVNDARRCGLKRYALTT